MPKIRVHPGQPVLLSGAFKDILDAKGAEQQGVKSRRGIHCPGAGIPVARKLRYRQGPGCGEGLTHVLVIRRVDIRGVQGNLRRHAPPDGLHPGDGSSAAECPRCAVNALCYSIHKEGQRIEGVGLPDDSSHCRGKGICHKVLLRKIAEGFPPGAGSLKELCYLRGDLCLKDLFRRFAVIPVCAPAAYFVFHLHHNHGAVCVRIPQVLHKAGESKSVPFNCLPAEGGNGLHELADLPAHKEIPGILFHPDRGVPGITVLPQSEPQQHQTDIFPLRLGNHGIHQ